MHIALQFINLINKLTSNLDQPFYNNTFIKVTPFSYDMLDLFFISSILNNFYKPI